MWENKNLSLKNFINGKWWINYRLLEDMKAKNINLSKGLVAEILIEKLTNS
jgi:hypothetical protein